MQSKHPRFIMKKYDEETLLSSILYGQYIKYNALQNLVQLEFANSDADEVNVFIDVYEMLLPLYRSLNFKDSVEAISSGVINYATHFRAYFRTRHRVESNIIFVFSGLNSSNITRFCPEYNAKYRNRILSNDKMSEQIFLAIERMKEIIPYLPNIYLKIGSVEPSVIIRDLILSQTFGDIPNVVVSPSAYAYQIPAHCPDTVVFRGKRTAHEITAYSYNFMNAVNAYIYETKNIATNEVIYPKLITAVMVLSGIAKRNISSYKSIGNTLELLTGMPKEIVGDIEAMYKYISDKAAERKWKMMEYELFYNRYMAISIEAQHTLYRSLPECNETGFLTQLNDKESVHYVNNKYFAKYPLDLERM